MTTPAPHLAPVPAASPRLETAYVPAPAGGPADQPRVFQVIHAVMREVMPVRKNKENQQQNYKFRGVDDAMSAMAGPMRNHGCFIAPEMVDHKWRPRGEKGTHTVVTMLYRIYGPAGDCLMVTIPGEAMDTADKSTNKAMSAALKYMLFQVFMIPVDAKSIDDADRETPDMANAPRQQGGQQRRGQQRQQSGQQPRRSNRAEPGPWEQQPKPQGPPRRDFLAEAGQAPSRAAFDAIRAAAVKAGAPADYLDKLDAIARRKEQANQQQAPTPQQGEQPAAGQQPTAPQQPQQQAGPSSVDRAAALSAMYAAAEAAGVTDRAEADALFTSRHNVKPADATLDQLRDMRTDLLDAAKGAAA
ncbi:ERF family protein [Streptomyces althioticus]|uniref:ERF family protein n=1 Tax=Streptomyces althioticus TaxID=83380 RepID=UPI003449D179